MVKKTLLVLVAFAACFSAALHAQDLFYFNVNIAPNSAGALEGTASLELRWASFAQAGLYFSASSLLETFPEGQGETTVLRSQKTLDLEVFRTPFSFLNLPLGTAGNVFISPVFLLNGVLLDETRYGHGTVSVPLPPFTETYAYYIDQQITWIKPLLGVDAGIAFGFFGLDAYFRTSWPFMLSENATGTVFHSLTGEQDLSASDTGFETRVGGTLTLTPAKYWKFSVDVDWIRHIGVALALNGYSYVYEMDSLDCAVTLAFPLGSLQTLIGAAFVQEQFLPLDLYDVASYTNQRFRFIFGVKSK